MKTRKIDYVSQELKGEAATPLFHIQVASSENGLHHAVAVPRAWDSLNVPVESDPTAPQLESLHIEAVSLGEASGVIACGSYPRANFSDPKVLAESLMARDHYSVQRWNDEDVAIGGARVIGTTKTHTCALRVLPHEDLWVFVSAVIPTSRMEDIGGVLHAAIVTFALAPGWSRAEE